MDFIDYREKLGIGFCDEEKFIYFLNRFFSKLEKPTKVPVSTGLIPPNDYRAFCDLVGVAMDYSILDANHIHDLKRYQCCLKVLREHSTNLFDFLSYAVSFVNSIGTRPKMTCTYNRKHYAGILLDALNATHIQYELLMDNDEYFIFPKGIPEFDDALVSQPLEWLKAYPKSHKTYCTALRQYSDGIFIRDVADNLRKTLEGFLQEFLCNDKNLETNKNEICKYLGTQGIDAGISGLFQPLINAYKNINDRIAKHNDKVDKKMLEFLLYQTGVLIRMVLVVKQAETEEQIDAG